MSLPPPVPGPRPQAQIQSSTTNWLQHHFQHKLYQNQWHSPPAPKRLRSQPLLSLAVYAFLLVCAVIWTAYRLVLFNSEYGLDRGRFLGAEARYGMLAEAFLPVAPPPFSQQEEEEEHLFEEREGYVLVRLDDALEVPVVEYDVDDLMEEGKEEFGKMIFVKSDESKDEDKDEDEENELWELEIKANEKCPVGILDEVVGHVFAHVGM
ncbi:hypothetical protein QBC44DRAFT_361157 [Cladorrhinum sp. PSN332]|nr:hypothetical protein QBC44DRAFT_361157 [Cladorrhinum sp. PSN332]